MTTILIVENEPANRDIIQQRLIWEGYDTLVSRDDKECFTTLAHHRPDLILMDIALPGLSGWELTTLLKADPATASIPIIALTAYALPEDRARSFEAGCDEYETKPVNFQRLSYKISGLLGNHHM